MYLVDTNVLLRFVDRSHSLHPAIRSAMGKLRQNGHTLYITSQNCIEFWNVATRPIERNGFGLNPANADRLLRLIERLFSVLPDNPAIYLECRRLKVLESDQIMLSLSPVFREYIKVFGIAIY